MSEAGTYTIDKDSSPEQDRGRGDIERGFALAENDVSHYSPTDPQTPSWEDAPVTDNYKVSTSFTHSFQTTLT